MYSLRQQCSYSPESGENCSLAFTTGHHQNRHIPFKTSREIFICFISRRIFAAKSVILIRARRENTESEITQWIYKR
jgi:hypothetical protein